MHCSVREKCNRVLEATFEHSCNLATCNFIYEATYLILRWTHPCGKERSMDSYIAGLVAGYCVFGTSKSSTSQQIILYMFSRLVLASAKLCVQLPRLSGLADEVRQVRYSRLTSKAMERVSEAAWPIFASMSWAGVMWMFRWHPEMLQPSLRNSITYCK